MKRLIEQTACEHGEFGDCGEPKIVAMAPDGGYHTRFCDGGSSREVTVDYEAGAKFNYERDTGAAKHFHPGKFPTWEELSDVEREAMVRIISPIVDAALAGGW